MAPRTRMHRATRRFRQAAAAPSAFSRFLSGLSRHDMSRHAL